MAMAARRHRLVPVVRVSCASSAQCDTRDDRAVALVALGATHGGAIVIIIKVLYESARALEKQCSV